ncbi:hypothetical protein [Tautonia rosea]|nr:hypothetical protein [Tautonia rosea]
MTLGLAATPQRPVAGSPQYSLTHSRCHRDGPEPWVSGSPLN